jgi:hypothetical protein
MKPLIAFLLGAAAATVVAVISLAPEAPANRAMPASQPNQAASIPVPPTVAVEPTTDPTAPATVESAAPAEQRRVQRQLFVPPVITRTVPQRVMEFAAPPSVQPASWSPNQEEWMFADAQIELPPPEPNRVTLTTETLLTVRLIDSVSSERHQPGDIFLASLDEPIVADGFVIAERGANVEGRVVAVEQPGRVKGKALIAIELTRIETTDGQVVDIRTQTFEREAASETAEEARKVGIGASLGALIGGIAGGGKGAAIGAAIGGGASTGTVLATKGQPALLESETRITFRLNEPVTIVEKI